jgi:hypothetical protein
MYIDHVSLIMWTLIGLLSSMGAWDEGPPVSIRANPQNNTECV